MLSALNAVVSRAGGGVPGDTLALSSTLLLFGIELI